MLLKLMLYNIYFNVFIFFINTSVSDAFYESFFIPAGVISIIRLLLNLIFSAIVFYYILTNRIRTKAYRWIIVFILFIAVTISFTPEKFEAIKMYINYIGPCCYFALLFLNVDKDRVILYLKNYCNILVIGEILALLVFRKVGYMGEGGETGVFRGIHLSRSTLIIYLNFCIFIYLYYLLLFRRINNRIKKSVVVMIGISIILIILSRSSTGIVIASLFLPLLFIVKNKKIANKIFIGSLALGILLPLMNLNSSFLNKIINSAFHKNLTFSGRRYIWDFALDKLLKNPLIGSGFNATDYLYRGKVF